MSSTTVSIDDELLAQAKEYGKDNNRSALEQFEYWAKIGKIIQDNPELSYKGMTDVKENATKLYKFD